MVNESHLEPGIAGGACFVGEMGVRTTRSKNIGREQQHHARMMPANGFQIHTITAPRTRSICVVRRAERGMTVRWARASRGSARTGPRCSECPDGASSPWWRYRTRARSVRAGRRRPPCTSGTTALSGRRTCSRSGRNRVRSVL